MPEEEWSTARRKVTGSTSAADCAAQGNREAARSKDEGTAVRHVAVFGGAQQQLHVALEGRASTATTMLGVAVRKQRGSAGSRPSVAQGAVADSMPPGMGSIRLPPLSGKKERKASTARRRMKRVESAGDGGGKPLLWAD